MRILASVAGSVGANVQAAPELAERSFGSLDFSSDSKYGGVWLEDTKTSSFRPAGGGPSVQVAHGASKRAINLDKGLRHPVRSHPAAVAQAAERVCRMW